MDDSAQRSAVMMQWGILKLCQSRILYDNFGSSNRAHFQHEGIQPLQFLVLVVDLLVDQVPPPGTQQPLLLPL